MDVYSYFLLSSILAGQLIKLPIAGNLGPTLLDLCIGVLCALGLFKLRFKLKNPPLFLRLGILFIFTAILSLVLSPLRLTSSEYLISTSYIVRLFLLILFAWVIYSDAFLELRKKIPETLLVSGMGIAVLGLLQFIFLPNLQALQEFGWDPHYFRTVSTFLDPNFTGAFLSLSLILLVKDFSKRKKWQSVFFILVYLALLTTFSRSSYLMFLVSGLVLAFLKKSRKIAFSTLILFIILLTGFFIYTQLIAKPRNIDREQSASFRLNTWQQGMTVFQLHPILGIGFNNYRYALREYNLGDPNFLESRGSSSNDSSLISVAATTGITGLIIYSLFLISLIKYTYKNNSALTAAVSGLLIHSIFSNSLFFPPILLWILLKGSDKEK